MPGGEAAILGMGKLGGREMTANSDLDLIVIYDYEGEDAIRRGEEPLPAPILRAVDAAPDQRAVGPDRRGRALRRRYAAAAIGQSGPVATSLPELHRLSERRGLDLGASRPDPRARGQRSRPRSGGRSTTRSRGFSQPRAIRRRSRRMSGPCAPRSPTRRAPRISGI